MSEQEFWARLQEEISNAPEIAQTQRERLVQMADSPPLPTQLIIRTACEGAIYLTNFANLNFPASTPKLPLSANQQLALEMCLSNSAIAAIVGLPATGKTRIATSLADAASQSNHQKRILILTHHSAALTAYEHLPGYPFRLSQKQDYRSWIIEQLRCRHLAQPQMDYLPLHLLPDAELAKLRTPAKLETWLPIIQTSSQQQLTEKLLPEFTHLSPARIQLLAYRLKQLEPLLQQQLRLSQLYSNLSSEAITQLAQKLTENPQVPILGTVAELMQPQHQYLWENTFDLIIVEESQYLTWPELMLISGLAQKLVLFGDEVRASCFSWLVQHLLPTYVCRLTEQFRLHPEIAKSVYMAINSRWIQTHTQRIPYHLPPFLRGARGDLPHLPQLLHRLIWQDVPNEIADLQCLEFLRSLPPELNSQIGIVTFCESQRDWLQSQLDTDRFSILIGTIAEWAGQERAIAAIVCTPNPQPTSDYINIALTRGQDYLILFGDYDFWQQSRSPLQALLAQPRLYKERTVRFS